MLIDDYIATLGVGDHAMRERGQNLGARLGTKSASHQLETSQRFVLSPLTTRTCIDLADPAKIEASRDYIFAPAVKTWIEWQGFTPGFSPRSGRHGFLIDGTGEAGDGSIHVGTTTYVSDVQMRGARMPFGLAFGHDFAADDMDMLTLGSLARVSARMDPWKTILADIDLKMMGAFLGACLALIATPRVSTITEHDHAKLNAARAKKGQPALLRYEVVEIAIDDLSSKCSHRLPATAEMALHHVRAHLRLRLGKVELVKPHWRGNPNFGVIWRRHLVTRAEDEAGTWQGGPPDAPQVIRQMGKIE